MIPFSIQHKVWLINTQENYRLLSKLTQYLLDGWCNSGWGGAHPFAIS